MLWRSEFDANIFGSFPREGFDINDICCGTSGVPFDISLFVLISGICFGIKGICFLFDTLGAMIQSFNKRNENID